MAKQLNWLVVDKKLRAEGLTLFTPHDVANLLGASEVSVRFLLTRAVKRGDAHKFRRGLYTLATASPSELVVANALYRPSYLSFAFALSYHRLIPESVYAITSATPRTTATFTALGRQFIYHHIKPTAFSGYRAERLHNNVVWVAEPEKALVDTLYFVWLGKQALPERLNTGGLSKSKVRAFAKLFGRPELLATVENIL